MSDYIKREDAIAAIEEIDWFHVNDKGRLIPGSTSHMESYVPYDRVESAIQTVPAADVVEVVRCKDCKYAKRNDKHPDKPLICYLTRRVGEVNGNWFCADGERRLTSHAVSAGRRK